MIVKVIHATNTRFKALKGVIKSGQIAKIRISEENFDFAVDKTMVVKYSHNKFQSQEIIDRAMSIMDGTNAEYEFKYHPFENNCEHFATWCATGERFSVQVRKFRMIMKMFLSRGLKGISNESERNNKAYERGLLCKQCFERNNKLFGVKKHGIRREEDVNIGDIITFTYWGLNHDAVVMDVKSITKRRIELTIAHYAFCGPFSHRTIKKEPKRFPLDGSIKVSEYSEPDYSVYSAEEVVTRANRRIDEQLFAFFANDSSHFARWCKLKLTR